MNQEVSSKTQTRTEKQITNISENLIQRAKKLDLRGTNIMGNEIRVVHIDRPAKNKEETELRHTEDDKQEPLSHQVVVIQDHGSGEKHIGVSKSILKPNGNRKEVGVSVNSEFGVQGEIVQHTPIQSWESSDELDESQSRKAAAGVLGHLRGEIARREIEHDNRQKQEKVDSDLTDILKV